MAVVVQVNYPGADAVAVCIVWSAASWPGAAFCFIPGIACGLRCQAEQVDDRLHRDDQASADVQHRDGEVTPLGHAIRLVRAEAAEDRPGGRHVGAHT